MKILCLISFCVLLSTMAAAQQLYPEFGVIRSSFRYKNSSGEQLDNLLSSTGNYLALGFRNHILKNSGKLQYNFGLAYNEYGATGSDNTTGNTFDWKTSYLGINLGFEFEFLTLRNLVEQRRGFSFYLRLVASPEFLLEGRQTVNNRVINLVGEEQFESPILFLRGGIGVNYCVSKNLAIFGQYMGGRSFSLVQSNSNDGEKLHFLSHTFSFGLLISLFECRYCYTNPY